MRYREAIAYAAASGFVAEALDIRFPDYCANTTSPSYDEKRSIPPLSSASLSYGLDLVQTTVIIRHGARAMDGRASCWTDYKPTWDCDDVHEESTLSLRGDPETVLGGKTFPLSFDVSPEENPSGGTCVSGGLLREGAMQHRRNGELLKQYLEGVQFIIPGVEMAADSFYFRSTNIQRTRLSGTMFLEPLVRDAAPGDGESGSQTVGRVSIPIHTRETAVETMWPAPAMCPPLKDARRDWADSNEKKQLDAKYADLRGSLEELGAAHDFPEQAFNCMLTTVCASHFNELPPSWQNVDTEEDNGQELSFTGRSALDRMITEVSKANDEYTNSLHNYNDRLYSKLGSAHFMIEIKTEILRAIIDLSARNALRYPTRPASAFVGPKKEELMKQVAHTVHTSLGGNANSLKSLTKSISPNFVTLAKDVYESTKRILVFSGHDWTLLPFLASIGGSALYGDKWTPYASEIVLELYADARAQNFYFRLIFNGKVITSLVPGCGESDEHRLTSELCLIRAFFCATPMASPDVIEDHCGPFEHPPPPVW